MTCLDCTTSPLVEQKPYIPYNRRPVYGVGINDFPTPVVVNGKNIRPYSLWATMLKRCYSTDCQKKQPAYTGCSVSKEWLSFTAFEKWFSENYIEGYQLDKDLLVTGNRVYAPETCIFVSHTINSLLLDCRAARGEHPLGVSFNKRAKKYVAQISTGMVRRGLGYFSTALAAHQAWQLEKAAGIESAETDNPRIRAALGRRVAQLRDDYANNRITVKL